MDYLNFLKESIDETMSLSDIVYVFEKMCEKQIDNDMVLFETGTFSFTGEPYFYFSLVRQFPNDEEEFYQIHVDILFMSNRENQRFSEATWNEEIDENIFDYIRKSKAYEYAKSETYEKIEIYMDET